LFHASLDLLNKIRDREPASPERIKQALAAVAPQFVGSYQQDAHEYFLELIGHLHTQFIEVLGDTEVELPTARAFDFHLARDMTCAKCQHTRGVEELFRDLSLDVVAGDVPQLVQRLEEPEEISIRCEKCEGQTAISRRSFLSYPPILCVHLKRFVYSPAKRDYEKTHAEVQLPLKWDLGEPSPKRARTDDQSPSKEVDGPAIFHLCSVVCHMGASMASGHYIAYVKESGVWRKYDDSQVSTVPELPAHAARQGYLVFYARQ